MHGLTPWLTQSTVLAEPGRKEWGSLREPSLIFTPAATFSRRFMDWGARGAELSEALPVKTAKKASFIFFFPLYCLLLRLSFCWCRRRRSRNWFLAVGGKDLEVVKRDLHWDLAHGIWEKLHRSTVETLGHHHLLRRLRFRKG